MGTGTDAARMAGGEAHADLIDNFKDQLLIALLKRLQGSGNSVTIPVKEVDDTGGYVCSFSVNDGEFRFVISQKQ